MALTAIEYAAQDALGLAELVARGEISAAELLSTARNVATVVDPEIGALVEQWEPHARDGAGGPFMGVPFLIKDTVIQSPGRRSELGSRLAEDLTATAESELMRRFREAGLVTFGRTKAPEMIYAGTTEPAFHGPARNPWDTGRSTGGSSGGLARRWRRGSCPSRTRATARARSASRHPTAAWWASNPVAGEPARHRAPARPCSASASNSPCRAASATARPCSTRSMAARRGNPTTSPARPGPALAARSRDHRGDCRRGLERGQRAAGVVPRRRAAQDELAAHDPDLHRAGRARRERAQPERQTRQGGGNRCRASRPALVHTRNCLREATRVRVGCGQCERRRSTSTGAASHAAVTPLTAKPARPAGPPPSGAAEGGRGCYATKGATPGASTAHLQNPWSAKCRSARAT